MLHKYPGRYNVKTPLERGVLLLSKQSIKTKIFSLLAHDFRYRRLFNETFIYKTG